MSKVYEETVKDKSNNFVYLFELKNDYLKYRFPALFIWAFSLIPPEITFYVVLSWIIAFIMTYLWSIPFSIIMLVSSIGIYIDHGISNLFLLIFILTYTIIALLPKEIFQNPVEKDSDTKKEKMSKLVYSPKIKKPTKEEEELYKETAKLLKGEDKKIFMARVVKILGDEGESYAQREFGWSFETIKKDEQGRDSSEAIIDYYPKVREKK